MVLLREELLCPGYVGDQIDQQAANDSVPKEMPDAQKKALPGDAPGLLYAGSYG